MRKNLDQSILTFYGVVALVCVIVAWATVAFADDGTVTGDPITSALPLLAAALASWLLALFRTHAMPLVPNEWIPALLPLAGGLVAGLSKLAGFDIGDFNPETADLNGWQTVLAGMLTGFAMTGMHQAQKQLRKD